ncbi:MAG: PKD domain-containing protein [Bacteroidia bacterium]|nr:PKD domain-containing protein [Bacteroidia bacterium]
MKKLLPILFLLFSASIFAQVPTTSGVTTNVTCNGLCDGSIDITVIGGTQPYSYMWSTGASTEDAFGLCTGTYVVTVIDDSGLVDVTAYTIIEPTVLIATLSGNPYTCAGTCWGYQALNVSGGTAAYTYLWPDSSNSSTHFTLCVGPGTVLITDANGCQDSVNYTINQSNINSFFSNSGIYYTMTIPTFTFYDETTADTLIHNTYWDFGDGTTLDMYPGNYTATVTHMYQDTASSHNICLTVMDTMGCSDTFCKVVSMDTTVNPCTADFTYYEDTTTANSIVFSDMAIADTAINNWLWDFGDGTIDNITLYPTHTYASAGNYTVCYTIYTVSSCSSTTCMVIQVDDHCTNGIQDGDETGIDCGGADCAPCSSGGVTISTTNVTCNGLADGSATATPIDSTANYTYGWSDGQTASTATGLMAGTYNLSVYDDTVMIDIQVVTIVEPVVLTLSLISWNNGCSNNCQGYIQSAPNGGAFSYTYSWNTGDVTSSIDNLCANEYSLILTDANGCTAFDTVVITEPDTSIMVNVATKDVSCTGGNDGSATVNVSNSLDYITMWSNGQMGATAYNLAAGSYSVVVMDSMWGCTDSLIFSIGEPDSGCVDRSMISGFVYVDDDENCDFDSTEVTQSNWLVMMTPGPFYATTDADGNYSFIVDSGSYEITLVANYNYNPYWSVSCPVSQTYTIDVDSADIISGVNFGVVDTSSIVSGYVYSDANSNCSADSGEASLVRWYVCAVSSSSQYLYTTTDTNGYYQFNLGVDTYEIRIIPQSERWTAICPSTETYSVTIGSANETHSDKNFAMFRPDNCADPYFYIYQSNIRPCFNTYTYAAIYNWTGDSVNNAEVEITFDEYVTPQYGYVYIVNYYDSSYYSYNYSWTYDSLVIDNSNYNDTSKVLTLNFGNLSGYSYAWVWLVDTVYCDPVGIMGLTQCIEGVLTADNICSSIPVADTTWDKSSVAVEGWCIDDSLAHFVIYNTGENGNGDMDGTSEYRIYVNNSLAQADSFQIVGGDSLVLEFAAFGNTIRLEADQRPGHPGNSRPRETIEGCGTDSAGSVVLGLVNSVDQDDEDFYVSIWCAEITNSYDPNDKASVPEGITDNHYIKSTDNIEYKIRFQNTGTDTAFTVVIRDTLSPSLDPGSIKSGASSHDYQFKLYGDGILEWKFKNILLPDSNVNEPASHGFIMYTAEQKDGNAEGTVIENTAGIYFDFNPAVVTNTVSLTVSDTVFINKKFFPCEKPVGGFGYIDNELVVTFSDSSLNNDTYYWDFGDGSNDNTQNPVHTYDADGTYDVTLVTSNDCGSDTTSRSITVQKTGLEEVSSRVQIYPNPNNGQMFIDLGENFNEVISITIHNIIGETVYETIDIDERRTSLDLSEHMEGIYLVEIKTSTESFMKKLMLTK